MKKTLRLFFALLLFSPALFAQSSFPGYYPDSPPISDDQVHPWGFRYNSGTSWTTTAYKPYILNKMQFRLLFPPGFDSSSVSTKKYPLVILMHGIGEKGEDNDNNYQLKFGGREHLNAVNSGKFNGFVMVPQSNTEQWTTGDLESILLFVQLAIRDLQVDEYRVQLEGYSAGGSAAWRLADANPKVFTGIVAMSTTQPTDANRLKYTATWHTQGGLDTAPSPSAGNSVAKKYQDIGANYTYYFYNHLGHGTWDETYGEPDFFPFLSRNSILRIHPLFFKSNFCEGEAVSGKMGIKQGFEAYEWRKDGALIPGATTNEISFSALGSYQVRLKNRGEWTDWSEPLEIKRVGPTPTPTITALGPTALPTLDGRTSVTLEAPEGNYNYAWSNGETSRRIAISEEGTYTVITTEKLGCPSAASNPIKVTYNKVGVLPAPTDFVISPQSESALSLSWKDNSTNETGFEAYRSMSPDGPWTLAAQIPANTTSFTDQGLNSHTRYYYSLRAVSGEGGSDYALANGKTSMDTEAPTAPTNLRITRNTRSAISLMWEPATDNADGPGTIVYEIYSNNKTKLVGTTTNTDFTVSGLAEEQSFTFAVRARDVSANLSPFSNQVTGATSTNGLIYSYYEGDFSSAHQLQGVVPIKTGRVPNFDIKTHREQEVRFGFKFEGYINIPRDGEYTFYTISDDGSSVFINGFEVVDNDGRRQSPEMRERSGKVQLTAGFHEIVVLYFNWRSDQIGLEVYWEGPGISRQRIPDAAFTDNFKPGTPPAKPSNVSAEALDHQSIKVSWKDNSSNETGFEVFRSTSNEGPFTFAGAVTQANTTSFTDQELQPSTTYYYKVLAVSGAGESEFSDPLADGTWPNATTLPSTEVPLPAAPGNLTASRDGETAIQLSWTDNADNEDRYEIFRNGTLYTSLAANSSSYLDEDVTLNQAYTYTVRAVNATGPSPMSNEVTVPAEGDGGGNGENTAPVLAAVGDISARFDRETSVALTATDADGDVLSFSVENLPPFASLQEGTNGKATLVLNPTAADQGTYSNVRITVTDEAGATASETITITVSDNEAPQCTPIAAQTLGEKESRSVAIYAFDAERDVITLSLVSPPGFVTLVDEGSGRGKLHFAPGYGDAGTYTIGVKATDSNGNASVSQFELVITNTVSTYTVMINFNDRMHPNAAEPWNNFNTYPAKGAGIYNLKDAEARSTKIDVSMLDDFGRHEYGATTGNNSGIYPDDVLKTYFYNYNGQEKRIRIKDLDPELTYTFSILGSTTYGDDNPPSEYIINGQSKTLQVQNNTSNVVRFENLKAPEGEITIGIRQQDPTRYSYINALVIDVRYDGDENGGGNNPAPAAPSQLSASIGEEDKLVALSWTDNSANETGFEIHRSSDNTTFTKIGEVAANTTTFTDPTPYTTGTRLYYRLRAANGATFSTWSNVVSVYEEGDGGGEDTAPSAPTQLSATHTESNTILLSWTDTSGNEKGYTIARSMDGTSFTEIGSAAANATSFTDPQTPAAGTTIWYRVQAYNDAGTSAWSNTASVTIDGDGGGNEQVPVAPTQLSASLGSDNAVLLRWTDNADNEASFEIQYSTDGTSFASLGQTDANTTLYSHAEPNRSGANYYRVRATNQAGPSAWSNTAVLNLDGSNLPPVISDIPTTVVANEGVQTEITFELYDPEGMPLKLSTRNLPYFASIEQASATTGKLVLNPTIMDRGNYPGVQFTAYDGALEADVTFTIQVADGNKRSTYINFTAGFGASRPWNNTSTSPAAGKVFKNLLDESGEDTGYTLTLVNAWGGSGETGETSENDSGIFPDIVTRSHYWISSSATATLKVGGLAPNMRYNFVFYGSTVKGSHNGSTKYAIGGETVSLEVQSNIDKTVQINGIKASSAGEVEIKVSGSGGPRAFLGAMVIESYSDGGQPLKPEDFRAHAVSRTQVDLIWHDKSYQEQGFEIWRRQLPSGEFALVHTTEANATAYSDQNLQPSTGYEYRIRAKSASDASPFTPIQQAATLSYLVYINTNFGWELNQGSPWNNLTQAPTTEGRSWSNFGNDAKQGTGISMRLDQPFSGGNAAGADANGEGIYPDKVIKSFYFTERGVVAKMRFSGLSQKLLYNFRFFSSSVFSSGHGVTEFRIGDKKRTLEIHANISKTTVIRDVRPDENGMVTVEVESGEFDNYGILNAMVLEVREVEKETKGATARTYDEQLANWQEPEYLNEIHSLYPNPSKGAVTVEFTAAKAGKYTLQVTDPQGRTVHVTDYEAKQGTNRLVLDLSAPGISPGLYLLRMKSMDFNSKVTRFMKQ